MPFIPPPRKVARMSEPTPSLPRRESLRELLHLFRFLRPYRVQFGGAMLASMVSMSFGALFPWLVGLLIDTALPSLPLAQHLPRRWSVDTLALMMVGTLLAQAALTYVASFSFNSAGERAVIDLRTRLFSRIVALPMRFFGERRVGELASRLSSDLAQIHDMFAFAVPQAIRMTMLFATGAVAIVVTSPRLALVMICSLPPVVLATIWFGRKVRRFSRDAQDRLAETATVVEETLQNIASVKAYTSEGYEARRYASALERFLAVVLPAARLRAVLVAFFIVGCFGSITLVLWYGARLMQAGALTHGKLTTFTLFTLLIGGSVASAADLVSTVNRTLGASERVRELLREEVETGDGSGEMGAGENARRPTLRLSGDVRFDAVEFRYPSRPEMPVLRGLSLHARPGEKIALVGPSGAGKSTVVSLLLRFYEPDAGQVLLDGKGAATLPLAGVRGNMAIVPQEVLLFGGSIRENIAYGRVGATEEEVRSAARRANCDEFITAFPEGYETLVGDRGVKLSGGQRQRIAIARALLKDPAILILDEATSSLDSESEHLIQEALATLLEGRTAFIIAHRLSTIRKCDCIYVIEAGQVTESGTHEELVGKAGGTYRRLSELQFSV